MYTLGIDVHKDESHVIVLDDDDEIHDEVRVRNANLEEIAKEYAGAEAAIEATSNYFTVYDTLDEHLDVVVADPTQTKALGVVEAKNDRLDAKLLAQLRSGKLIAHSYVPPKDIRERRALVRGRKQLAANNWSRSGQTSKTRSMPSSTSKVSPTSGIPSARMDARSSPARTSLSAPLHGR